MTIRTSIAGAIAVCLALTLVAAPAPARADGAADSSGVPGLADLSLDQLLNVEVESVYGASRYTQRSLDAPTRVTVVTADDIRDHGYRTLAEALRSVAGLFVSYDHTYEYLGMRGLGHVDDYNSRVLVMVDGHRTNDNIFEGALIGTEFPVDVSQVDRIEVIRGPGSALYGSNAVQGVVNVVTRHARRADGWRLTTEGGSLGLRGGQAAYGGPVGRLGMLQLAASGFAADGVADLYLPAFDSPLTNHGIARNIDGENAVRFLGDLALHDFHLQGVYGRRRKDVPTASFGTVFNAPGFWTVDSRSWLDLGWRHAFARRLELSGRVYFDDYEYEGSYPTDRSVDGSGPVVFNRDDVVGQWVGAEFSAHQSLFGSDEFVLGGEWRENLRQDQHNWDVSPAAVYYNDRHNSSVWAAYAEDVLQLAPRLRFNAGVRHDEYTTFAGSTHPRVGLIWSVLDRTTFKLLYGSAFRVPTSYEVYLWGSGENANRTIRPETFRTGEAALESYFAKHFHTSASWYVFRGEDFIQETEAGSFTNSGDVRGSGIELECSGRWREAELRVGGSRQIVRFQPGDLRLSNSPATVLQASGKVPLVAGHLWASTDVHAIGPRLNPFGVEVPGFTVTDVNVVARQPGGRWQLLVGARNALDTRYGDVAGPEMSMDSVPQDGRTFRAQLDVRY